MTQDKEFETSKGHARNFGGAVYVGGVVAATALFISFVLTAFPPNAYLSRVIMTIAGLAVGCSMLAFPYALHNWIVEKKHRNVATWLYYIEMLFISVNTIVSFVTLLAKVADYAAPEWAVLYEPFSVLSIIYVVFAWGTIFLTDPQAVTKQKQREYEETFQGSVADMKLEYLKSPEGRYDIAAAAQNEILAAAQSRQPKSFFGDRHQSPALADQLFQKKELALPSAAPVPADPISQQLLEKGYEWNDVAKFLATLPAKTKDEQPAARPPFHSPSE